MMLVGGGLRVALATTHLPLTDVPRAITRGSLLRVLRIVDADLKKRFGLKQPRILVAGLNPHSGESGHLGSEDEKVIAPAIADAVSAGIDAKGPIPADTLFVPERVKRADAVLAMYHDQGLPVLKYPLSIVVPPKAFVPHLSSGNHAAWAIDPLKRPRNASTTDQPLQ